LSADATLPYDYSAMAAKIKAQLNAASGKIKKKHREAQKCLSDASECVTTHLNGLSHYLPLWNLNLACI